MHIHPATIKERKSGGGENVCREATHRPRQLVRLRIPLRASHSFSGHVIRHRSMGPTTRRAMHQCIPPS